MEVDTLRLLAQPKEGQQQFKNKKQPELTEYRTARKSNNPGDKEETFSQTVGGAEMGRRGRGDSWKRGQTQRLADCGTNGAGSGTASRPRGPTFAHR